MRVKEGNKERDILEAAIKVFGQQGYHTAKISKIAEVANVATGSVYVYFKNKEDILLKIFQNIWDKLFDELKEVKCNPNLSPTEKVDSMIDMVFDIYAENPSLALVFVNEQHHVQRNASDHFTNVYYKYLDLGEEIVKEGIEKKIFSENLDVKILRYYIFGALRTLLHLWAHDSKTFPLNRIRQNVKYLTKRALMK